MTTVIRFICSTLERAEAGVRRLRLFIRNRHAHRTVARLNRNRRLITIHA